MELSDFKIGNWFYTATGRWYILDRGQRTVVAISESSKVEAMRAGCVEWDEMLPYADLFDPYDFGGCDECDSFN